MTIKKILSQNKGNLEPKELDQLLALALHKNIEYIYKNPDKKLAVSTIKKFYKLLNKRLAGWTLAYLKGYKEFYGLKFLVNKYTLIPRPESELLVDEALKSLKKTRNKNVIDIGTGSGNLIIAIAKNYSSANYWATDISSKALQVAKTNARKYNLKKVIKFIKSDLLKNIPKIKFDIIVANLPYLTPEEMKEPSIKKEPSYALLGGQDGLDYYNKLLGQIPNYLNKKYLILLEIAPSQQEKIKRIIKKQLFNSKLVFKKDLAGNIRVVKITN